MTIEPSFLDASSFTDISQGLSLPTDVESDRSTIGRANSPDEFDDRTMIWRFAQGKKRLVTNQNLRIDYAHNSLQLSTPNGELIAIHKVAKRLHYVLVKKDSKYSDAIQEVISECQFIPIDTASAERGFMRYQKYDIPEHYTLQYEPAAELWQAWQDRQQIQVGLGLDILILARSKWYRVQQMLCTDDRLDLQTRLGLISLSLRDRIAWIAKLGNVPAVDDADLTTHQNGVNIGTDSDILGKIISRLAIEALPDGDLDSEPNSQMHNSVFHQLDESALLYDGERSSMLTDKTLSPIAQQLRASTISVLEDYLEHGETIVRTETVVDAQGNVISEKTVSTHRSCPRWAIEAIVNLS
ncbi:hypothetical protein [Chamaesiphon sp. GL140_3_metabinner_50]|uniref:hypothetical protein n=1 Tax=Chamaesiphon sp. GL140_3_metabinner_50 TaxID=2970812 RepID=UPI0025FB1200|nr:hypothetical protein [Chamaesiphon sp. GL140_3_metabinner_50]